MLSTNMHKIIHELKNTNHKRPIDFPSQFEALLVTKVTSFFTEQHR
uniref:Uncharacterized protein n=1 Tax=Rhizophora mucronata TaxID=61149 RepID=A0A2P2P657_RHIMU